MFLKILSTRCEAVSGWGSMMDKRLICLFRRVLVSRELDHLASHPVDGLDDLEHLVVGDGAVLVDVVELEGP